MSAVLHVNKEFKKVDYSEKDLSGREFENCRFIDCNFFKSDLSNNNFIDCIFENCNLGMVRFDGTGLRSVQFKNSKLMGVDFSGCNNFLFAISCHTCNLDYALFVKKKMKNSVFEGCSLKDVDFSESDLSGSVFNNCDMLNAVIQRSILEKVDFRTAYNYTIDPELNKMSKAKFSSEGLIGLLRKYKIEVD